MAVARRKTDIQHYEVGFANRKTCGYSHMFGVEPCRCCWPSRRSSCALRPAGDTAGRDPKTIEERLVESKREGRIAALPGERRHFADTVACGALGASATEI